MNSKNNLIVLLNQGSTFIDYTDESSRYDQDTFNLDLLTTSNLYVGFRKPISSFYIYLKTPAQFNNQKVTAQYWNGTSWVDVSGFKDDSRGFSRSAFLGWEKNQLGETKQTINGVSAFFYKIKTSADISTSSFHPVVAGINIVFADDRDLKTANSNILNPKLLETQTTQKTSWIGTHVEVRDYIIQNLRNKDYKTVSKDRINDLTAWDLLDIDEVKQGAIYLTLSRIYFNLINGPDDQWMIKSAKYEEMFQKQMNLARISIDSNDDGIEQPTEQQQISSSFRISR